MITTKMDGGGILMSADTPITEKQYSQVFVRLTGREPRSADIAIMHAVGMTVGAVTECIWDHWMGEPETPSMQDVEEVVLEVLAET